VRGADLTTGETIGRQRRIVDAFLAALRAGDVPSLVSLLDPEFSVRADAFAAAGLPRDIHGAENWAKQAVQSARGAKFASPALIDGSVGLVIAPRGRLFRVLRLTIAGDRITAMEVIGDPERLRQLELGVLEG
jgi:RNA polymerase sigma-70 factor (ECF subfamily)